MFHAGIFIPRKLPEFFFSVCILAQNTNDWRAGEPIQNLIDPELFVMKFASNSLQNEYVNFIFNLI